MSLIRKPRGSDRDNSKEEAILAEKHLLKIDEKIILLRVKLTQSMIICYLRKYRVRYNTLKHRE